MQRESGRNGSRTVEAETVTTQKDDTVSEASQQRTADADRGGDPTERILDVLSAHLSTSTATTGADARPDGTVGDEQPEEAARHSGEEPSVAVDRLAEVATELRALNGALETLAETRRSTPLGRTAAVAEESGFEWVDTEQPKPSHDEQADRLAALESRLDAIESTLDEVSLAELEAAVDRQATAHAELEARLEGELDSIEAVFERMVTRIEELEERLDSVDDTRQAALEPLRQRAARQDALVDLTQEALRHRVTAAVCHNCDQSVDLGVLETPFCPRCDRRFTGVSAGSWLPFSKPVLRTAEPRGADLPVGRHARQSGESH